MFVSNLNLSPVKFFLVNDDALWQMGCTSELLRYLGRNSLPLYWLNGFALVAVRCVAVKVVPDGYSVMLALSIFAGCVLTELLALQAVKHIPVVRHLIGAT